jgi:hypothetical protein
MTRKYSFRKRKKGKNKVSKLIKNTPEQIAVLVAVINIMDNAKHVNDLLSLKDIPINHNALNAFVDNYDMIDNEGIEIQ